MFEGTAVKELTHYIPAWRPNLPHDDHTIQQFQQSVINMSEKLSEVASSAVTPVKHVIVVRSVS
jgi:hypothetical protein